MGVGRKKKPGMYSVGADTGQPLNVTNNSITNNLPKSNSQILETVSMAELYDTVYPSKPPLVDGLLYGGCLSVCWCAETWQELFDGADCLPYQQRDSFMGLSSP